jgi:hypothetical protein
MTTRILWILGALTFAAGCSDGGKDDSAEEADADTDTDADADADADTDTDAFVFQTDDPSTYTRVDRMGMPAVATAVISSKDAYNAANPTDDAAGTFVPEIVGSVEFLHGALDDDLESLSLTPCGGSETHDTIGQCIDQAAPYVVPDVLRLDTTAAAGFPNGRGLADPVIDVTLALILLDLGTHPVTLFADLPLNPPANDVAFSGSFPYLAAAH